MKKLLLIILCFAPILAYSQEAKPEFGIKFGGYVKTDVMYDTRQSETARDGLLYLYPKAESLDANGKDLNESGSMNILSLQTRLTGKISAPDFLGAKTSGVIEGEFFGNAEAGINELRLPPRLYAIGLGQYSIAYWPVLESNHVCRDNSRNYSIIARAFRFQVLARSPQIRVTQKFGCIFCTCFGIQPKRFYFERP